MCGIAGILNPRDPAAALSSVRRMVEIQHHRGPDGCAIATVPGAVFGHNRLAILDLTANAAQPMLSADHRHVMVFNGEIYNFKELRKELESGPEVVRFSGTGDSEVLLAAFRRWGEACLQRLDGMFAFCVYDRATRAAFLARDRFGQKPLVYWADGQTLVFASEVKALLAAGLEARPNRRTWTRYLTEASYDDDGETFFAGAEQLQPGECAWHSPDSGLRRRHYYRLGEAIAPRAIGLDEAAEHLRPLLDDVAVLHMRSDVPVGVSLSGGLDSSALLACLDRAGQLTPNVKCFSVDFGGDYSERQWVEAATNYHRLGVDISAFTPQSFRDSISPLMWHLEGPIGGLMNCALRDVMSSARTVGVTVLLDGTGLDEAFGGYRTHHDLFVGALLRAGDPTAERALYDYAENWRMPLAAARNAALAALEKPVTAIDGTVPVRPDLLNEDIVRAYAPMDPFSTTGDRLRDSLVTYLQVSKIPRNMRMKDRLGMGFGLELRLPFLDHRLVEFGLGLPPDLWFQRGRSKSIIREALRADMDEEVRVAPKRSVHAPQGLWLRTPPMRDYVERLIASESFAGRGFFDIPKVSAAYRQFCGGGVDNSFFVWQWINLEEWFRAFVDSDAVEDRHSLCPDLRIPQGTADVPTEGIPVFAF